MRVDATVYRNGRVQLHAPKLTVRKILIALGETYRGEVISVSYGKGLRAAYEAGRPEYLDFVHRIT
jgi:hypothetical protein